ncbi:uncharacterized protein LOC122253423 [Penaeus japonicus]|uniref:uncharacterized protein LOC122253423 n=1 Tax=Penaeus japonicus TaxID=27405 RepID=UPI001C7134AD|nr:uncharacterized protein LOC122253423 [Penaeus japonicus]
MADQKADVSNASLEPKKTPHSLITEEHVKAALKTDKGPDARPTSWVVKDFTKKGDNYACVVTSIEVQYQLSGIEHQVTYIAKLNPCRHTESLNSFATAVFEKETGFYREIVPLLNAELQSIGQDPLKFARCFATFTGKHSEVIILEDLRPGGFQMFDRKKGMDKAHTTLVVKELGRLHAASKLMMGKLPYKLEEKYPFIKKDFTSFSENPDAGVNSIFKSYLHNAAEIAERIGGYENVVKWLRNAAPDSINMFEEQIKSNPPFEVICHGDCWNNNVLFSYSDEGVPTDVRLVDLQICRKSSPATDLNYLMYTSLNGNDRRENIDSFLNSYYNSFSRVLKDGDEDSPFTIEELKREYRNKHLFGLLMATMVVPIVVSEATEVMDLDNLKSDDVELFMKEQRERMLKQLDSNPLLRPRLLSVFDDMVEYGVI